MAIAELQKQMKYLRQRVDRHEDKLDQTTARMDFLETAVEEDREKTVQAMADHSERMDFQSNQTKSHCVLITGNGTIRVE
jgi:hypothetical protein